MTAAVMAIAMNIGNAAGQMTMTLKPDGEVIIYLAGTGSVTIDWGDRTPNRTYELTVFDREWDEHKFTHTYTIHLSIQ